MHNDILNLIRLLLLAALILTGVAFGSTAAENDARNATTRPVPAETETPTETTTPENEPHAATEQATDPQTHGR